jgi:peptidoglycan/xylan/chitin deacetylase (PgdA/CDA1 family)
MPADPSATVSPGAAATDAPARPGKDRPWLLMYHSVADATVDPYRVTVSPARLERQLDWLRRRGLRGVGVGQLLGARQVGRARGMVGLTFDDGYADFVDQAVPLLHRYGCTATVFVLPGRLGGSNVWDAEGPLKPLLTADGIRAAADAGMEIGSHGMRHLDLTAAGDEVLHEETVGSRARIAELTGRAPQGFCYPYGRLDERAVAAVRAAGYGYACAVDPRGLTGVHALPRVHVGEADTNARLLAKRLLHPVRRRALPAGERR